MAEPARPSMEHGMPGATRHRKSASKEGVSAASPVHHGGGGMIKGHIGSARKGQAPPATSLPGSLGIIEHPSSGHNREMGIPGIISSTSLGPEQRQRLVQGIIEDPMGGHFSSDAVHKVLGHDATAYNDGMIHIRGSSFK